MGLAQPGGDPVGQAGTWVLSLGSIIGGVDCSEESGEKAVGFEHSGGEENDFIADADGEGESCCPGAGLGGGGVTDDSALFEVGFSFAGLGETHK